MPGAAAMLDALPPPADLPWQAWAQAAHADYLANLQPQALPGPIDMPAIIATLQQHLPADTVVTNGAGNFASWVHRFYQYPGIARGGKVQLAPTNGAMGYGVPAGIAASILTGRAVFTIAGDGDFMMNGQELATAVQYDLPILIVVVNNGSYGTIRMHQERHYPGRVSATELHNPDFAALARAYGAHGERVETTEAFGPALDRALASGKPALLELILSAEVITPTTTLSAIRAASLAKPVPEGE